MSETRMLNQFEVNEVIIRTLAARIDALEEANSHLEFERNHAEEGRILAEQKFADENKVLHEVLPKTERSVHLSRERAILARAIRAIREAASRENLKDILSILDRFDEGGFDDGPVEPEPTSKEQALKDHSLQLAKDKLQLTRTLRLVKEALLQKEASLDDRIRGALAAIADREAGLLPEPETPDV